MFDLIEALFHREFEPIRHELRQLRAEVRDFKESTMGIEADIADALVAVTNAVSELNANVVTLEDDFADEVKKLESAMATTNSRSDVDMTSLNASLATLRGLKDRLGLISTSARNAIDAATSVPVPDPVTAPIAGQANNAAQSQQVDGTVNPVSSTDQSLVQPTKVKTVDGGDPAAAAPGPGEKPVPEGAKPATETNDASLA